MRNVAHASSALRSKKSAQLDEASNQIAPAPQTLLKTTRPIHRLLDRRVATIGSLPTDCSAIMSLH
jgi:hypothetical protein